MIRPLSTACFFALLATSCTVAVGQTRFGSSGTSAFGSSGFGSSGFGSSGFGSSGFGSSGFGSSGFGSGGTGMGGFGSSGFGSSSSGMGGFGSSGFGGSGFGNQGFGTSGYGGVQNFVGRDSADMASTFGEMGQILNQMNRNMNRGNRNRDERPAPAIENSPQVMRVSYQVAFDTARPAPAVVANNLRARLGKILASHSIAQPIVTMEGDVAVIGGVAATDSQRLVLEKLVSLEPGVRGVRNEMTVIPQAAIEVLPDTSN